MVPHMRYVLAFLACFGLVALFGLLTVDLQHGGGMIPKLILFVAIIFTWRAITKQKKTPS